MDAIVISTTPGREDKLKNCLESLGNYDTYRILVLSDFTWELGKIKFVYDHTTIDNFLLLHDTCEIKDPTFIKKAFQHPDSVALTDTPVMFGAYLGKYRREVLSTLPIPVVKTKEESIAYETQWNCEYYGHDLKTKRLFDDFQDRNSFCYKWGQLMMKVENKYLIKYKSTYNEGKFKAYVRASSRAGSEWHQ